MFLGIGHYTKLLEYRGGFKGGVDRGVHPCWPWSTGVQGGAKISIPVIAVNVHYYKYSWVSRDVINFTGGQLQIDTLSSD